MDNKSEWIYSFFGGETDFYGRAWGELKIADRDGEKEAEQVAKLLRCEPGSHVLDWCGGWGRHAIPLARRGFKVSLLDFSKEYLERAEKRAGQEGLKLNLVHADFRQTPPDIQADVCINMFTAGLGYLGEEDDIRALKSLHATLKLGARFLIDTMNLFWIARNFSETSWNSSEDGKRRLFQRREFLFQTGTLRTVLIYQDTETGREEKREIEHRLFSPESLIRILEITGFAPRELYGGFNGSSFDFNSKRLIVISEKL